MLVRSGVTTPLGLTVTTISIELASPVQVPAAEPTILGVN